MIRHALRRYLRPMGQLGGVLAWLDRARGNRSGKATAHSWGWSGGEAPRGAVGAAARPGNSLRTGYSVWVIHSPDWAICGNRPQVCRRLDLRRALRALSCAGVIHHLWITRRTVMPSPRPPDGGPGTRGNRAARGGHGVPAREATARNARTASASADR